MIALFDSNIVIDYLNGVDAAQVELRNYKQVFINPITWVEAQVKAPAGLEDATRRAMDRVFTCVDFDREMLQESLVLRRTLKLKLPDAMILATARVNGWQLVTRNTKDFPATMTGIRVPYRL